MLVQIWPSAVAAIAMAAAVLPLDRALDPPDHGTAVGVLLLGAEGLAAMVVYGGLLVLLAPDTIPKLRELIATARRRGAEAGA
jgi:hypothetical protein